MINEDDGLTNEQLVRTRKQVQVLSQQLEEERKNNRKTRDQLGQMSDLMTQQDRVIEKLRSDVASRESEILAGKQQINMLSMIISQKRSDQYIQNQFAPNYVCFLLLNDLFIYLFIFLDRNLYLVLIKNSVSNNKLYSNQQ